MYTLIYKHLPLQAAYHTYMASSCLVVFMHCRIFGTLHRLIWSAFWGFCRNYVQTHFCSESIIDAYCCSLYITVLLLRNKYVHNDFLSFWDYCIFYNYIVPILCSVRGQGRPRMLQCSQHQAIKSKEEERLRKHYGSTFQHFHTSIVKFQVKYITTGFLLCLLLLLK